MATGLNRFLRGSAPLREIAVGTSFPSRNLRDEGLNRSLASLPKIEMRQRDHDERVTDLASLDQRGNLRGGQKSCDDVFAMIELGLMPQGTITDEHRVAGVALNGGVGENFSEKKRFLPFVAGFFAQLADAGDDGRGIFRVNHAAGDFEGHRARTVPVLFHHDDLVVGRQRDDVDPVGGVDDVEVVRHPGSGRNLAICSDLENPVISGWF